MPGLMKVDVMFLEFMNTNLIAVVTDGANVMTGRRRGLSGKLKQFSVQPKVYQIHYMAHRLHLSIRRAWSHFDDIKKVEGVLNNIYKFYNNPGHKQLNHLREMASSMELDVAVIPYVYESRWIASEHRTVKNVLKSWKALVENLQVVLEDTIFDQSTRQKASALYDEITGVRFLLLLNFFLDVLQDLKFLSLKLQKTDALLVTQSKTLLELQASILLLSDEDGATLKSFKVASTCSIEAGGDINVTPCPEEELYRSDTVT